MLGAVLARAGDAQQRLALEVTLQSFHQLADGLGLVAGGARSRIR